jgi:hypothetical protein
MPTFEHVCCGSVSAESNLGNHAQITPSPKLLPSICRHIESTLLQFVSSSPLPCPGSDKYPAMPVHAHLLHHLGGAKRPEPRVCRPLRLRRHATMRGGRTKVWGMLRNSSSLFVILQHVMARMSQDQVSPTSRPTPLMITRNCSSTYRLLTSNLDSRNDPEYMPLCYNGWPATCPRMKC